MQGLPPENVQEYPRPPALEPAGVEIVVRLGGNEIIRTDQAWRVLETHHAPTYYIPRDAFFADLIPVRGSSICEWKGRAAYFDVAVEGVRAQRAAWSYERPTRRFQKIANHIALYAWAMEGCTVGGMAVDPQPGDFYGGWVTSNLTGIVKGGPGTEGW